MLAGTEGLTPSVIDLLEDGDEGVPLTLSGQVLDAETGQPIAGAEIYLYHADANGEYHPTDPSDESTAKFSGEVISDQDGFFTVYTIVPREYDQGNQHIHVHYARAEGYEQTGGVILFDHDVSAELRQWAEDTGFGWIIPLDGDGEGMAGSVVLELKEVEKPIS